MKMCFLSMIIATFTVTGVFAKEGVTPQPATSQTYIIKAGDTLDTIAQKKYGDSHYSSLLILHNGIKDETKLRKEQELKTPDLKSLLSNEGLAPIMEQEIAAVLKAKALFSGVKKRLSQSRLGKKAPRVDIPADIRTTLTSAADHIDAAILGLKRKKEGVGAVPLKMIGQLASVSRNLKQLSTGSYDGYGYDLSMVNQRLVHAMLNGIKWARNGYK